MSSGGESVSVVNVERPTDLVRKPKAIPLRTGIRRRKVLIESETPERKSAAKVVLELESTEEIGTETV
jgi:hypothetical protein